MMERESSPLGSEDPRFTNMQRISYPGRKEDGKPTCAPFKPATIPPIMPLQLAIVDSAAPGAEIKSILSNVSNDEILISAVCDTDEVTTELDNRFDPLLWIINDNPDRPKEMVNLISVIRRERKYTSILFACNKETPQSTIEAALKYGADCVSMPNMEIAQQAVSWLCRSFLRGELWDHSYYQTISTQLREIFAGDARSCFERASKIYSCEGRLSPRFGLSIFLQVAFHPANYRPSLFSSDHWFTEHLCGEWIARGYWKRSQPFGFQSLGSEQKNIGERTVVIGGSCLETFMENLDWHWSREANETTAHPSPTRLSC